jgi:hypothetical protein
MFPSAVRRREGGRLCTACTVVVPAAAGGSSAATVHKSSHCRCGCPCCRSRPVLPPPPQRCCTQEGRSTYVCREEKMVVLALKGEFPPMIYSEMLATKDPAIPERSSLFYCWRASAAAAGAAAQRFAYGTAAAAAKRGRQRTAARVVSEGKVEHRLLLLRYLAQPVSGQKGHGEQQGGGAAGVQQGEPQGLVPPQ